MADKAKLEQRLAELETERLQLQAGIDAAGKAAEQADRNLTEAIRQHDLEGNDRVKPDIEKYRADKATAQSEIQRLQALRDEIPARLAAIRLEVEHVNHRSDLQLLVELKKKEQAAFLEFEKFAVGMLTAHYDFKLRRHEREQLAEKITNFARSHQTPAPSRGSFTAPAIEVFWNDISYLDHIKRLFQDAKREFN